MNSEKLVIIGSGPAGLTAAIYAARAGLNPLVISGDVPGGQLTTTTEIANWPGGLNLTGGALMFDMEEHAKLMGARIEYGKVTDIYFSHKANKLHIDDGSILQAEAVIIATGAYAKRLGIPSEEKYYGAGVSGCATCDGPFFLGKEVAIIGGGNAAVEEAIFMSSLASKVHMFVRGTTLRCEKILETHLLDKVTQGKVSINYNHEILEILGDGKEVTGANFKNKLTNQDVTIDLAAIFVAIGHQPNTDIFKGKLLMDNGYISKRIGNSTQTSMPGVFAAGDVSDYTYRQAITSAGEGCKAALDALAFLEGIN